tara:strand:+ start:407 stop:541 length:135 start_codon:yes stop_codon:yes gene_type:complete
MNIINKINIIEIDYILIFGILILCFLFYNLNNSEVESFIIDSDE